MIINKMVESDIEALIEQIYPSYFSESGYNMLTPNYTHTRTILKDYLQMISFVLRDGERIAGIGVAECGNSYYSEKEFDVGMFYIHPDYRGTNAARDLRDALVNASIALDAKLMYTSCLSGLPGANEQLFLNLWSKKGFKKLGTVMIRIDDGR